MTFTIVVTISGLGLAAFIIHRRGRLHLLAPPAASSASDTSLPREQREASPTA